MSVHFFEKVVLWVFWKGILTSDSVHEYFWPCLVEVGEKPNHLPNTFKFPVMKMGNRNRSCQSKWFEEFGCLHYDESRNGVFCYYCVQAVQEKKLLNYCGHFWEDMLYVVFFKMTVKMMSKHHWLWSWNCYNLSRKSWNWIYQIFAGPPQYKFRRDPPGHNRSVSKKEKKPKIDILSAAHKG